MEAVFTYRTGATCRLIARNAMGQQASATLAQYRKATRKGQCHSIAAAWRLHGATPKRVAAMVSFNAMRHCEGLPLVWPRGYRR